MYSIKYLQVFWKVKGDYCMWPSHSTKYQYISEVCTWLVWKMYKNFRLRLHLEVCMVQMSRICEG